jgi:hypothetical protein
MAIGRSILTVAVVVTGVLVIGTSTLETAAPTLPPLTTLVPGGDLELQQDVPVNVILVGWDGLVDPAALQSRLAPFNGVPDMRDNGAVYMALRFDFDYTIFDTPQWFDDAFFGLLSSTAVAFPPQDLFAGVPPLPMTPDQAIYTFCNVPTAGPNLACDFNSVAPRANGFAVQHSHLLDGPFVEQVLAQNLAAIFGIDTQRPTVVLINWFGRADYIDHVYIDPYEPNPATGEARWAYFANMTGGSGGTNADDPESCGAFGCAPHRVWFHDLSAGPFFETGSYNVTLPELFVPPFANGIPEYRIHHTADYLAGAPGTYRVIDTLVDDLARLVNDTYLSQIAFAFPVYQTHIMPPRLPYAVQIDLNRWNWDPDATFEGQLNAPVMLAKMNRLAYSVSVEVNDQADARTSRLGDVYSCSLTSLGAFGAGALGFPLGDSCYGNRLGGFAGADLYLYFRDRLNHYLDGDADYEVPAFQFLSTPGDLPDLAGLADSNYDLDNFHQQFLWLWTAASFPSGHNHLLQHETGHHFGFSHPFHGSRCLDASCSEIRVFNADDDTFYSWNANAVSGVMGYHALNDDFSVFETDNLQRYRTWDYLRQSNEVLDAIAKKNNNGLVMAAIVNADSVAAAAIAGFETSNYASAVEQARAAYDQLVAAADAIEATVPSPEKALRRWHRAKHASFRRFVDDATADLAAHFDPRVPVSRRSHGPPVNAHATGVSPSISRQVPDLRRP